MSSDIERNHLLSRLKAFREGRDDVSFDHLALEVFKYQFKYNTIYQTFCINLGKTPDNVQEVSLIPYLPVTAFKHHIVTTGVWRETTVFKSSATTGAVRSAHFVRDVQWYKDNTLAIWNQFFKPVADYCFLALLPGYLERSDASLVGMVDYFIKHSMYEESGFYLNDYDSLYNKLTVCRDRHIPVVLFGVSFALLDFAQKFRIAFPDLIIIETGGLKGRYNAMTREEIYSRIKDAFGVKSVYSEYGMTELFSQAYSYGDGLYVVPDVMKVTTKQINDPLSDEVINKTGILVIIDLWNLDSCAFIQTEDLGIVYPDGSFKVIGRLDNSELRGCNLMVDVI